MAKKKKSNHHFWKRLHFKYRLSVINENTLEELSNIRVSIFSGLSLFAIFAVFLITITSVIIITTPIRYYLPGYLDSEIRSEAIHAAIRIDSLEEQVKYHRAYLANLNKVFAGTIEPQALKTIDTTATMSEDNVLLKKTKTEQEYVQRYEEEEKYNLSVLPISPNALTDVSIFYKPTQGRVIKKSNPLQQEYGIIIATAAKENVVSVADGSVIFASYDVNDKYIIQVQHKNGFVSIYKHTTLLLKKVGDKLKTGEVIALIDQENTKEKTYLYFELWYKSIPVNPEDYISF